MDADQESPIVCPDESGAALWSQSSRRSAPACWAIFLLSITPVVALGESATRPSLDPLRSSSSYGEALVRMLITLGAIVVALIVAAKLLPRVAPKLVKRYARPGARRLIEVLDAQPLDRHQRLYVVRVEGERFLISSGEKGVTLLSTLGRDAWPEGELDKGLDGLTGGVKPPTAGPPATFADVLAATREAERR
jgi:flagellar biogenesis protein FliO